MRATIAGVIAIAAFTTAPVPSQEPVAQPFAAARARTTQPTNEQTSGTSAVEQLEAARAVLRNLELRLDPQHPDVRRAQRQVAELQQRTSPAPPPSAPPAAPAKPATAPEPAARPQPAREPGQLVTIKIDVAVVEEGGNEPMVRRATSLLLADRQNGSVRVNGRPVTERTSDGREVQTAHRFFVDAFPMIQPNGRTQVQLTLDYGRPPVFTSARVEPLLESGKTAVVAESVDPGTDRRIRVEMTATILK